MTFPPPGTHALHTPVSVLAFDNSQELLWTGNEYVGQGPPRSPPSLARALDADPFYVEGRVTSFYGVELQKYSSFRAHLAGEGPVRQLLFNGKGVISVASRSVHMSLRRGLARWNITYGLKVRIRLSNDGR